MGGSGTRGSCWPALPLFSSLALLEVQQTVGLPAAELHGDTEKLLDKGRCTILEAELQQVDQDLFVQLKEAQHRDDEVLQHGSH